MPGSPLGPCAPAAPTSPLSPFSPCAPVAPVAPAGPWPPVGPGGPVTPAGPAGPVGPAAPWAPASPFGPAVALWALVTLGAGITFRAGSPCMPGGPIWPGIARVPGSPAGRRRERARSASRALSVHMFVQARHAGHVGGIPRIGTSMMEMIRSWPPFGLLALPRVSGPRPSRMPENSSTVSVLDVTRRTPGSVLPLTVTGCVAIGSSGAYGHDPHVRVGAGVVAAIGRRADGLGDHVLLRRRRRRQDERRARRPNERRAHHVQRRGEAATGQGVAVRPGGAEDDHRRHLRAGRLLERLVGVGRRLGLRRDRQGERQRQQPATKRAPTHGRTLAVGQFLMTTKRPPGCRSGPLRRRCCAA